MHLVVLVALALVLLSGAPSAGAQEQVVIPAPPPAGDVPTWLDNPTTRRFMEWQELERRWHGLKGTAPAYLASSAAELCLKARDLPREGEPQPGLRARLLRETCAAAINAQLECYDRRAPNVSWQRGFIRVEAASDKRCASWSSFERIVPFARDAEVPVAPLVEADRVFASVARERRQAADGQRILDLPECERIEALRSLLARQEELDGAARALASVQSEERLARLWEETSTQHARYVDVAAFHLAEARLLLYGYARARKDEANFQANSAPCVRKRCRRNRVHDGPTSSVNLRVA